MTTHSQPDPRPSVPGQGHRRAPAIRHLFGRVAASSAILLGMRGAYVFLLFLTGILLGRTLGPEQYGIFAFGFGLLAVLTVPARLGFDNLLTAEIPTLTAHGRRLEAFELIRWALGLAALAAITILLVWALLALWGPPPLPSSLWIGGLIALLGLPPMVLLHIRSGGFRGQHLVVQGQLPILLIQPTLLFAAVATWGFMAPGGLNGRTALMLLTASIAITCLLSFTALPSPVGTSSAPTRRLQPPSGLGMRALPYLIIGSMTVLMSHMGVLILGFLEGEREAGLFQPAAQLAGLVGLGLQMINQPLGPKISQLHAEKHGRPLQGLIDGAFWSGLALGLPAAVILLLGGRFALGLYGPEFEAAVTALTLLTVGQVLNLAFGPCALVLMMTGAQRLLAQLLVLAAILNLALAMVLVPPLGIEGAAWATFVAMASWNVAASYAAARWRGVRSSPLMGWSVRASGRKVETP